MCIVFFFQAEDGIRYLVRSRGLGDVYKRQAGSHFAGRNIQDAVLIDIKRHLNARRTTRGRRDACLLYTFDAADERFRGDLGGRRIIKKKNTDISAVRMSLTDMN